MSKSIRHFPKFSLMASFGKIKGITRFRKFGYNSDIDTTTTPEDVVSWGGVSVIPTTASTLSIVSSDAQDDVGGTGTSSLYIKGLDINYNYITEVITLDGLTPVITTNSFLYVESAFGLSSGSNYSNVGNITITKVTGGDTVALIPADQGRTQHCFGIVPKGCNFALDTISCTVSNKSASAVAIIHFEYMLSGSNTWQSLLQVSVNSGGSFTSKTGHDDFIVLPEKTIFKAHVEYVSANNTEVTANIGGYMVNLSEFSF